MAMPNSRARSTPARSSGRTGRVPVLAVLALQVLQILQGVLPQPRALLTMPAPPKRPRNAYILFSNEQRAELAEKSRNVTEIAKLLGKRWSQLSKAKKDSWTAKAGKDKDRYQEELRAYEAAHGGPPPSKRSKKSLKQVDEQAKRALSPYNLFVKERMPATRAEMGPGVKPRDAMKVLGKEWAELSEEQKAAWKLPATGSGALLAGAAAAPQVVAAIPGASVSEKPKEKKEEATAVAASSTKEKQRKTKMATPLPKSTKTKTNTSS